MSEPDITALLQAWAAGDRDALDRIAPHLYDQLRRIARSHMRRERPGQSLESAALVHEAWLRIGQASGIQWNNRVHFISACAGMMRRILVDAARRRKALRRGGAGPRFTIDEAALAAPERTAEILALDSALEALAKFDARKARIVELRFFGGLSVEETALALGLSEQTIHRDWSLARAWLRRELRNAC